MRPMRPSLISPPTREPDTYFAVAATLAILNAALVAILVVALFLGSPTGTAVMTFVAVTALLGTGTAACLALFAYRLTLDGMV